MTQSAHYNNSDRPSKLSDQVSIVEVVEGQGIKLTRNGSVLVGLCPFHDEKTPSFIVFPNTNSFHCFGCGIGGDPISFIEELMGYDFKSACDHLGIKLNNHKQTNQQPQRQNKEKNVLETSALTSALKTNQELLKSIDIEAFNLIKLYQDKGEFSIERFNFISDYVSYDVGFFYDCCEIRKDGHLLRIYPKKAKEIENGKKQFSWQYRVVFIPYNADDPSILYENKQYEKTYNSKQDIGLESEQIPFYNEELIDYDTKCLFFPEGEKDNNTICGLLGLKSITLGITLDTNILTKKLKKLKIKHPNLQFLIIFSDNDKPGLKQAKVKFLACVNAGIACLVINPITGKLIVNFDENDLDQTKLGNDISDFIEDRIDQNMDRENIISELNQVISECYQLAREFNDFTTEKTTKKTTKETTHNPWLEQAIIDLFEGNWLSLNGSLYQFNGKYYELIEDGEIQRKIANWCRNYIDTNGQKTKVSPTAVDTIFKWANKSFFISPNKINQDGLPLVNGILRVIEINGKIQNELIPHSPSNYFTYCSDVAFNPNADNTHANRLLECVNEPYKSLLIQSLATILNIPLIRKKHDRIKSLICVGEGSNGKDTLRHIVSLILGGQGMTSCNLNDFKLADQSRAFNLARLATNPKINWSSENASANIDKIQSLKQVITGDPLYIESKGKDGIDITLNTLFIFNSNSDPSLKGNQKAISSRFTLIPFDKVYANNPSKGELKSDPRYKHDREFLINEVCPSFLNLLIDAFKDVYVKGINYELATDYADQVRRDSNHLLRFCNDIGLEFTGNDSDIMYCGDIYDSLYDWYFRNGYIKEEAYNGKLKDVWIDTGTKDDPVIKSPQQIKPRFKELFPKAKDKVKDNKRGLTGIAIKIPDQLLHYTEQGFSVTSPVTSPVTSSNTSVTSPVSQPSDQTKNDELEKINDELEKTNTENANQNTNGSNTTKQPSNTKVTDEVTRNPYVASKSNTTEKNPTDSEILDYLIEKDNYVASLIVAAHFLNVSVSEVKQQQLDYYKARLNQLTDQGKLECLGGWQYKIIPSIPDPWD